MYIFRITDPSQRENLGIIVSYKVKVKLSLGPLGGDVVAELPFILMHPKPEDDTATCNSHGDDDTHLESKSLSSLRQSMSKNGTLKNQNNGHDDDNLIQLDADPIEEDLIFEDFARLRLRGGESAALTPAEE